MSKKMSPSKTSQQHPVTTQPTQTTSERDDASASIWNRLCSSYWPYVIITLLGFVLYANTLNHEYALDDDMLVVSNSYVLKGTAGIADIMKTDVYDSYNKANQADANLAGGRFRPLSLVTFAIEQQFIGTYPDGMKDNAWDLNQNGKGDAFEDLNKDGRFTIYDAKIKGMGLRHFNNILFYVLSMCILYLFLSSYLFKEQKIGALLCTLLFLAHPLHTEVVANVKSRDEILSLLFMITTLYFGFRYAESKSLKNMVWTLVCFFLAMLSKEYGVILLVLFPAAIYVLLKDKKVIDQLPLMLGMLVVFGIYFAMRSQTTIGLDEAKETGELLNNPYLKATASEAWATKIYINLKYFLLMLFPLNLSCDYSYNSIPYRSFASMEVWLSIVLLLVLALATLWAFRQRSWFLFPLLLVLMPLMMINNFFFNIGATMGERLVYHSTLGICLLLIGVLINLLQRMNKMQNPAWIAGILLPIILLYGAGTFARNPDWKNNHTLYLADIAKYSNSTFLNGNLLAIYGEMAEMPAYAARKQALLDSASVFGYKALEMHPRYILALLNMAQVKSVQQKIDSMVYFNQRLLEISPNDQRVMNQINNAAGIYYNKGMELLQANQQDKALDAFLMAHQIKPNDHRPLLFIGNIYLSKNDLSQARSMWQKGLSLAPNDPVLRKALMDHGGL
jgi:tetratricopeptide (TPR) repeat protein